MDSKLLTNGVRVPDDSYLSHMRLGVRRGVLDSQNSMQVIQHAI